LRPARDAAKVAAGRNTRMKRAFAWLTLTAAWPAFADPPAAPADLGVYAGRYPSEPVDGVAFLRHPRVRAAVEAAVPDARTRAWILDRAGQQTPIALRAGRLVSWGCEAHDCNDHEWTISIDSAGTSAEICYHVGRTMGDRSRWFHTGRPSELRPDESCPG
jgi:hypothetical protein